MQLIKRKRLELGGYVLEVNNMRNRAALGVCWHIQVKQQ